MRSLEGRGVPRRGSGSKVVVYGEVAGRHGGVETVAVRADGARARVVRPVKEGGERGGGAVVELPDGFLGTYYPAAKVQATGYRTRAMVEAMEESKLTGESGCTATRGWAVKLAAVEWRGGEDVGGGGAGGGGRRGGCGDALDGAGVGMF
ncbi:MAG: hypothetical protein IPJ98_13845, partial [Bryobacterales bacterium]|nr:hypothetical protein [Bryobacterales bacterium]